jgi:murein DD-endopeptidase MepM/ murein hydrolase activator NlpD
MQIILFREKSGRAQPRRVPGAVVVALALFVVAGLIGNVLVVTRFLSNDLLDSQIIAKWQSHLTGQSQEIERIQSQSRVEMDAVGRRLAAMQARLLRIEALGERVAEVAQLDEGEFRFDEAPAVGGPETDIADAQPQPQAGPEFMLAADDLAAQIKAREDELEVLASLLANQKFHEEVALAGWPVKLGWMSSGFGRRVDPITGRMAWHAGADFAGKPGSDVVAVASGVVTFAGEKNGYGRMIEINHGAGYITRYGHHDELLVAAGDVVKKGQVIGRMGSTGRSTGPHVHFEVLKDGHPVDPARYVARTRQT